MGSTPSLISASRGAALLGMSDWSTPVETWLKIMEEREEGFCKEKGFLYPEFVDNASTRWGNGFENAIADEFESCSGHVIHDREKFIIHPFYGFITCHPDGILTDRAGYEAKTTFSRAYYQKWGEPGTNRIPRNYQIQVQHQMLAADLEEVVVVVLVFPRTPDEWEEKEVELTPELATKWTQALHEMGYFFDYTVKANVPLQELMLDTYVKWWKKYVIGRTPPPAQDYKDIRLLTPEPVGTVVATDQIERWSAEYKDWTKQMSQGDKRKKQLKTLMLDYIDKKCEPVADEESVERWLIMNKKGKKIHSYNGKTFR